MSPSAPLFYRVAPFDNTSPGPHPLLVLLHGRGSDENDLLGLVPYLDPRFIVVSIRAPHSFGSGGYTWYDLLDIGRPNTDHLVESHRMLRETITHIEHALPVQKDQLYLLGFSMGAMMSFSYALVHPETVRAVVAHSGYIPEETPLIYQWNSLGSTAFFVAHGTEDPVVPISMGRRSNELLNKSNAKLTYREYPITHTIGDKSLEDLSIWLRNALD